MDQLWINMGFVALMLAFWAFMEYAAKQIQAHRRKP